MSNIPDTEWKKVPLGDVCLIEKAKHNGDPAPYVGLEDISNNTGMFLGDFEPTSMKSATFRFDERHLLYGRLRPYLNKALTPDFAGHCSSEIFPLRPNDRLDRRYLFYWLTTDTVCKSVDSTSTGARMPRANMKEVMRFEMPLPPLGEQRRIVAALDEAFEGLDRARAHAEANLHNASELFQIFVDQAFSENDWRNMELYKIVHEECSLSYGIVQPGHEVYGGLPIVRPTDMTTRIIDLEGLKRIDPNRAASYKRTNLVGGELLVCVRGTTGTVSIADDKLSGANVTRGIVPIRFDASKFNTWFAYYQFRSKYIREQIEERTYGAALMQINIRDLRNIRILWPSLEEQNSVAKRLDAVSQYYDQLYRRLCAKLAAIADLRQSILQRAFAGELT